MSKILKRENLFMQFLDQHKELSIKETISLLNISEATARRMFLKLENQNKLIRCFGKVRSLQNYTEQSLYPYEYDSLLNENLTEKARISQRACSFINDDDAIFIGAGTTTYQLSLALANRIKQGDLKNIIITTNSLSNLEALESVSKVVLIGGDYRPSRRDFCGYISERLIRTLQFSKCFLGVDGIDIDNGLMAIDIDTARLDELILSRSKDTYVLASSDKFSKHFFINYAPITRVKHIITDSGLHQSIYDSIEKLQIDTLIT